jgi:acyl-CoA dehydrogenase
MPIDSDSLAQLIDTIDRFVRERLRPLEKQVADEDRIPLEVIGEMKALGLFGLSIPAEFGGIGLDMRQEVEVALRLGHVAPAFRSVFGTNNGIGSQGIVLDGTDAQKHRYLPRLARGELIASFCLTEPDVGSDAGSLRTSALRNGDVYVLNGTKRYITNAAHAGLFTVLARTDPSTQDARGVTALIVEAGGPGITIGKPEKKMGQQGAPVSDVIFQDALVPIANVIGGPEREGRGFSTAMKVLDRGRLHIAALCVGIAERLIEECLHFAINRRQFGRPIAEFQLIQAMLADSRAECYAARCMVRDAARLRDIRADVTAEVSCAKMFASEMVGRVADRAVQIHGGAGYMSDYPVERLYRDVRLMRIYEGTTQIQQLLIARDMIRTARHAA